MVAYAVTLAGLVLVNAQLFHQRYYEKKLKQDFDVELSDDDASFDSDLAEESSLSRLFRRYVAVYIFCSAADWLQGSYTYSLYKSHHGLDDSAIARLFAIGFASAGVAGTFTGALADKYGRRVGCLSYCALYSVSCAAMTMEDIRFLILGRVLGGISTTLLYSVFEAWLVTELHHRNAYSEYIKETFTTLATINGTVAIVCGICSQVLVYMTGSQKSPFLASIWCLLIASALIVRFWDENHGQEDKFGPNSNEIVSGPLGYRAVVVLGLGMCAMEGAMYAMILLWTPAIQSSRDAAYATGEAPLGLIFANFMCAMMLGSWLLELLTKLEHHSAGISHWTQLAMSVAASSLSLAVIMHGEAIRFLAFCVFELCVGVYMPAMAAMKQSLIGNQRRGQLYALMRLPLNIFVIGLLGMVGEHEVDRGRIFALCSAMLLTATILLWRWTR
ncbi:hypothetical protein C1H76_3920 [Elsinoe australis]|uniref:Molybdate-anion transporter n=1 Tax=Elsinoe australis TaxID=40998 RepID=A0A4V6DUC6_9PEZI|nr:hypothetical protein C1H76_3920 [Elsinoe australis]